MQGDRRRGQGHVVCSCAMERACGRALRELVNRRTFSHAVDGCQLGRQLRPQASLLWTQRHFSASPGPAEDGRPALNFNDAQIAFASKTTFDLFRSWSIFKVCSWGWVVRHCDTLYQVSLKILGGTVTHFFLRYSLFNHFCAGESATGILPKMQHLKSFGVGGILDYAAEAKDDAPVEAEKPQKGAEDETVGAPLSARTYEYTGEKMCDANAEIFLEAVRAVKDATPDGFAAVKLSGLGDPRLLERMSTCLVELAHLFRKISDENAEDLKHVPYYCIDRTFQIDFDTFSEGWQRYFEVENKEDLKRFFELADKNGDGRINFLEWKKTVRLSNINALVQNCKHKGPMYQAALNEEEVKLYRNLIARVEKILDLAQTLGVRVMVDAEWTDIQPAIDHLVLFLQRKYNKGDRPIVFQTYQTYLKGMHESVQRDLVTSKEEGWHFGAKLVRGAYMVSEREKAKTRGVDSPVCDTYEDTEANYHASLDSILRHNAGKTGASGTAEGELVVASHNQGSIEYVVQRMQDLGRDPSRVYFGQLLGMADHLTFTLARNGYKAYKYVPYGPIDEVVPYLIRRTQENSAILGSPGVQEERSMVTREFRRRIIPFAS